MAQTGKAPVQQRKFAWGIKTSDIGFMQQGPAELAMMNCDCGCGGDIRPRPAPKPAPKRKAGRP